MEIEGTRKSMQSVHHGIVSRAARTWYIFPLPPWCPLGYGTGGNDHVDRDAVEVQGS